MVIDLLEVRISPPIQIFARSLLSLRNVSMLIVAVAVGTEFGSSQNVLQIHLKQTLLDGFIDW